MVVCLLGLILSPILIFKSASVSEGLNYLGKASALRGRGRFRQCGFDLKFIFFTTPQWEGNLFLWRVQAALLGLWVVWGLHFWSLNKVGRIWAIIQGLRTFFTPQFFHVKYMNMIRMSFSPTSPRERKQAAILEALPFSDFGSSRVPTEPIGCQASNPLHSPGFNTRHSAFSSLKSETKFLVLCNVHSPLLLLLFLPFFLFISSSLPSSSLLLTPSWIAHPLQLFSRWASGAPVRGWIANKSRTIVDWE